MDNDDAVNIIQSDGIGYAVQCYCKGDSFDDPETCRLWNAAAEALDNLEGHLERETGRTIDE